MEGAVSDCVEMQRIARPQAKWGSGFVPRSVQAVPLVYIYIRMLMYFLFV